MDPVSAVSLAATIVTFLDFSWNLVKGSYEIYRSESGASAGHAQIGTVLDDLEDVTKTLQTDVKADSPHRDFLKKLASECTAVSTQLSDILKDLKRKEGNKIWRSLEAKWNSMRKEKEVTSIEQRLISFRLELLLRLNLIISEEQSSVKSKLAEIEERGLHLSSERAGELKDVQEAIQRLEKELVHEMSETFRKSDSGRVNSLAEIRAGLSTLLSKLDEIPKTTTAEERILKRLYFTSIHARVESIADAGFGTFDWLLGAVDEAEAGVESSINDEDRAHDAAYESTETYLTSNLQPEGEDQSDQTVGTVKQDITASEAKNKHETDSTPKDDDNRSDPKSNHKSNPKPVTPHRHEKVDEAEEELRRQTRQSFLTWLETDHQVYHISGKAGSGKSTLMKFFCQHSRLKDELKQWAGGKKLVFASFFFWNSGDDEQKTLGGLYRSLLFEILRQCPELIKEAFPGYWTRADTDAPNLEGASPGASTTGTTREPVSVKNRRDPDESAAERWFRRLQR